MGWWLSEWFKNYYLKYVFIIFFKTIRGVKE